MARVQTENNGQIVRQKGNALIQTMEGMKAELARALPKHLDPDRMLRIAATAIRMNPDLAIADRGSFLGALLTANQLGLEVNTPMGHAYLIPRRNKGKMEATFMLGYQGMMELAYRTGQVQAIWTKCVYAADHFEVEEGLWRNLVHRPDYDAEQHDQDITHAYAVAAIEPRGSEPEGARIFVVLTRREIERRRPSHAKYGPWKDHFARMAEKSAIRALFRTLPKTAEIASATHLDELAEAGKSQASAYSSDAVDALTAGGFIDTEGTPFEPDVDPETGEVSALSEDSLPPEEDEQPLD